MKKRVGIWVIRWVLASVMVALPPAWATDTIGVVAVVNGEPVTSLQLERRRAQIERQLAQQGRAAPAQQIADEALRSLIVERIQLQAAKRFGIEVEPREVDDAIASIAARNGMDRTQLEAALQQDGISWATFQEEIRRQILLQRLQARVTQGSDTVSDAELDHFIAAFPDLKRRFAEEAANVVQTHVRHILHKTGATLTDEEAKARLVALKERLARGEDFAELARLHSEDGSAANGGDLGWVLPGDFVPEFETVMNRLPVGAVSDPVKTRFGWHLIQVVARRPLADDPDAFRNYARNKLRERKRQQAYEAFVQSLEAEAVIERPTGEGLPR
ncbi:peptidylprolyl isomerase [Hydrogenophilus thiooxidans]|uniref:peptidylprolyl isomerase n=1 Tax=Hydrogenophilus thiooxidans TaxID=2820326 RepID=UPI001C2340D4|nr:peptidylprolyl isomerase [Hydrogenophilus thiooxidans]